MMRHASLLSVLTAAVGLAVPCVGEAAPAAKPKPEAKPAPKPASKPAAKTAQPKKKVSKKRGETKKNDEEEEEYQWTIGLTGGGNFANIGGESLGGVEGVETNMNAGFNVGVLVLYNLASFADVEFGLGYSTKGYSTEVESKLPTQTQVVTVDDTFSYIEIPIGIRLNYPAGSIRPYLSAGLYVGILASSERSTTIDTTFNAPEVCPGDASDQLSETCNFNKTAEVPGASTFDAGFKAQLGAEFDVTDSFGVFAGVGYSRSFTDPLDETKQVATASTSSAQTPAEGEMPADMMDETAGGTDTGSTAAGGKNASQAHSVIQAVGGLFYQF
jgi:hypothetical protein